MKKYPTTLSKIFNDMVGKPFDEVAARQQAKQEGFDRVRIWTPDIAAGTMDVGRDRVNIHVNKKNIVTNVYIG